jgi:RNA processing factor Prp31
MVVVKKPRRLHDGVFFYIEGGHLLKVNQLVQTMIRIDQKVNKAIQLLKRCQSIIFKKIKRLLEKENGYATLLCFINKNVSCEKTKKVARQCVFLH